MKVIDLHSETFDHIQKLPFSLLIF